jgi:hypothetical protein
MVKRGSKLMQEILNGWTGLAIAAATVALIVWGGSKFDRWVARRGSPAR